MPDTILYDSALRLFADLATPAVSAAAETGTWPAALWDAVEAAGYPDVLADGVGGMEEAATILQAAGHHAAPIPLAETILARFLCARCNVAPPAGALTIAPVEPADRIFKIGDTLAGRALYVPWARDAAAVVLVTEAGLVTAARGQINLEPGRNLAGEPRDHIEAAEGGAVPLPEGLDQAMLLRLGALLRGAQMAGALQAVLDLSVRYANDRVQFGRPIGRFQAIQQQMAVLAEEAAAAAVAVERAAAAVAAGRPSADFAIAAAKIRAGEAVGKAAAIAHQVHGAIGFTHEHGLHRLTRRLWSWRDEFGNEAFWSRELGRGLLAAGPEALWPTLTAV